VKRQWRWQLKESREVRVEGLVDDSLPRPLLQALSLSFNEWGVV
jgi:hypothetical protein